MESKSLRKLIFADILSSNTLLVALGEIPALVSRNPSVIQWKYWTSTFTWITLGVAYALNLLQMGCTYQLLMISTENNNNLGSGLVMKRLWARCNFLAATYTAFWMILFEMPFLQANSQPIVPIGLYLTIYLIFRFYLHTRVQLFFARWIAVSTIFYDGILPRLRRYNFRRQ